MIDDGYRKMWQKIVKGWIGQKYMVTLLENTFKDMEKRMVSAN